VRQVGHLQESYDVLHTQCKHIYATSFSL